MTKKDAHEKILQISKEIILKFIETGRISPNSFPDTFKTIYISIKNTIEEFSESIPKKN